MKKFPWYFVCVCAAFAGAQISQAIAQAIEPVLDRRVAFEAIRGSSDLVRVQVGTSFFVTSTAEEGEEADKAREEARRRIYAMAAQECNLLKATLANECRLENITVHSNRHRSQQQRDGFQISGNMTFRVAPK